MAAGSKPISKLWIPVFWFLCLEWTLGPLSLSTLLLTIPLAALLGARHGRAALPFVAIGGLLLLPVYVSAASLIKFGGRLDIYIVALIVCALAAGSSTVLERARRCSALPYLIAAFVVFPAVLNLSLYRSGGLFIGLAFQLLGLLYFFLFLLGRARCPALPTVALLIIATVAGMYFVSLPSPATPSARLELTYRLSTPAAFMAGIAFFFAGRLWARRVENPARPPLPSFWAYALLVLVTALALGWLIDRTVLEAIGDYMPPLPGRSLRLLGSSFAMPLAGFLGGLLLGKPGIAASVLLVFLFWALNTFAYGSYWVALDGPLIAFFFGLLGLRTRS